MYSTTVRRRRDNSVLWLGIVVSGCVACGSDVHITRVAPSTPTMQVRADSETDYSATVENPSGEAVTFRWSAARGTFQTDKEEIPLARYRAPHTPGKDVITVAARRGTRTVSSQSIEIEIVPAGGVDSLVSPIEPVGAQPAGNVPKIVSIDPAPERCSSFQPCLVNVTADWAHGGQNDNQRLYVLVSFESTHFVQSFPHPTDRSGWRADGVFVGQVGDKLGTPFQVCVVASSSALLRGSRLADFPPGPSVCRAVTRGVAPR